MKGMHQHTWLCPFLLNQMIWEFLFVLFCCVVLDMEPRTFVPTKLNSKERDKEQMRQIENKQKNGYKAKYFFRIFSLITCLLARIWLDFLQLIWLLYHNFIIFYLGVYGGGGCLCGGAYGRVHAHVEVRRQVREVCSLPPTMCIPGVELKSSDLVASASTL